MTTSLITAITAVFDAIMTWLTGAIETAITLFWAEGALTFLGILALIALGISIFFLIVGLISNFIHLRG